MSEQRPLITLLVLLVAFAFAGPAAASDVAAADAVVHRVAPDATVLCDPNLPRTLEGSAAVGHVVLAPDVCFGLLLYGASPAERARIAVANWIDNVDYLIALGVLVATHEAEHALGDYNEASAERKALAACKALLTRRQWGYAVALDRALPDGYH